MEDADNITLLAHVVMEDHDTINALPCKINTIHTDLRQFQADTHQFQAEMHQFQQNVFEILERLERKLDNLATALNRHENWITTTAPIIGVSYLTHS